VLQAAQARNAAIPPATEYSSSRVVGLDADREEIIPIQRPQGQEVAELQREIGLEQNAEKYKRIQVSMVVKGQVGNGCLSHE
jgi:hypothetical protein